MNDVIEIRDLRCSAIVGVLREERDRAQPLSFNLDIERPFEEAAISDDINATTNYAEVVAVAARVAGDGAFLLLETLAYRVAYEVLAVDEAIAAVTVNVKKLRPPVPEDVATLGVSCRVVRA